MKINVQKRHHTVKNNIFNQPDIMRLESDFYDWLVGHSM